jgi:bifunctional non-homologous end joining protein LigD
MTSLEGKELGAIKVFGGIGAAYPHRLHPQQQLTVTWRGHLDLFETEVSGGVEDQRLHGRRIGHSCGHYSADVLPVLGVTAPWLALCLATTHNLSLMEITNAERVVFPEDGITKGEVADYYALVAHRMLPFIEGRALTVQRFPRGIGGPGFMQKNAPDHYPDDLMGRHEVPKEEGGTTVYPVVDSVEGIIYFANLGVITFHVPPVRVVDEVHPDWAIWDLDPPPDRVELVREAAAAMRATLEDHGIRTMPMASGSKGYHLRARLEPGLTVETVALVARGTAALAAAAHDDLLTMAFRKAERGDRVFVDWMRNTARSTRWIRLNTIGIFIVMTRQVLCAT